MSQNYNQWQSNRNSDNYNQQSNDNNYNRKRRRRRNNRNRNNNNNNNNYNNYNNRDNNSNYSGWKKPTKPYTSNTGCCEDDWIKKSSNKYSPKKSIYSCPYSYEYFDTHCHLDWILFKSGYGLRDLQTFANLNFTGKFGGCVTVACASDMIRPVSELINSKDSINKNIYGTFGLHPHNAKEWNDNVRRQIIYAAKTGNWNINQTQTEISSKNNITDSWSCLCGHENKKENAFCEICTFEPTKQYLENMYLLKQVQMIEQNNDNENDTKIEKEDTTNNNNKVVGIGECGLDFHYNHSPHHIQKNVFIEQIKISKELDLPLVVHSREAENDTVEIMKKYCPKNKKIHLHCFTDSLKYAKIMLDQHPNLFIGFTGAITFKKAHKNRETVKQIPLNRILLETDGPYMSPFPYRGKVSHPGYIPLVAEQIAQIKGIKNVNDVLKQCRINAKKMYGV